MAGLIGVPLKKSYDVDLSKPLKTLISTHYSTSDEPIDLSDAIDFLNKTRSSVVSRSLDPKHESSLELLEKYYDQIASLESKCPPSEIHVQFKWKDAFDRGGSFLLSSNSLSMSNLSYERICVLFNIGAIYSQIAATQGNEGLSNDNALKQSAKYFAISSGIFQALKHTASTAVGGAELTTDFAPEILNVVHVVMLAQAQEMFYYKAYNDNMKDHIIAKIANQCEDLYSDAVKQLQLIRLGTIDRDWGTLLAVKQLVFRGIAEYHQGVVCKHQKEFGEEISRLQKAVESLKAAEAKGSPVFTAHLRDHLNKATQLLEEAKKDNDFIYHAKVPEYRSLSSIGKAALAKPTNLPEKFRPHCPDLFEKLLPVSVQQAVHRLDVRKQDLVNTEIACLREQTQLLNGILASLNLPAAIEDVSGVQIPPSLLEKGRGIKDKGGVQALERLINELPSLYERNREILEETERQLKLEEESDESLRSQFRERWNRTPSTKLNATWKDHLEKYRTIIKNAQEADVKVRQKFNSHREKMELLSSGSTERLVSSIPAGSGSSSSLANAPCVNQLRRLLAEVEGIKAERESLETELKGAIFSDMKNKFLSSLAKDGALNEEVLSVEALGETYGSLQKKVRESKEKQARVVEEIQKANEEYVRLKRGTNGDNSAREVYLIELAAAHDAFMELLGNLEEGTKFYNDLTQLLANLQTKVGDFCFARKAEREDLCKHLQNDIVSQQTPAPPNAPLYHTPESRNAPPKPPRPPPPQGQPMQSAPQAPQPNLPFSQPQATAAASGSSGQNTYQPFYFPPPPLPSGFNPYSGVAYAQTANYTYPTPQTGYPQGCPPTSYPQQGGYSQAPSYPYPYPQQYGYPYPQPKNN